MAELPSNFRPYAAPANVIVVLQRIRSRNLPEVIDDSFLRVAGVPENVFSRVSQALRFLGLTEEDGTPTDTLKSLAAAPDAQYKETLAGALKHAYAPDFQRGIDPGQDAQHQIIDAFKPYEPRSQTARMVTFFLGICREAGMPVKDAPRQRGMADRSQRPSAAKKVRVATESNGTVSSANIAPSAPARVGQYLIGATEEDLALLHAEQPDEFKKVWDALGVLAVTRGKRRLAPSSSTPTAEGAEVAAIESANNEASGASG